MDKEQLTALLEKLCQPLGPPGREDEVVELLGGLLQDKAHRISLDPMGNLAAWINPDKRPLLMLDAHSDEVAFIVQRVDEKGFLSIAPLGGVDAVVAAGSNVLLQVAPGRHLPGVVGFAPPHVKTGADNGQVGWEQLFVDTGLKGPKEVAEAGIQTGAFGVIVTPFTRLGDCVSARNLDDRAGCAIAVALLLELAASPPDFGVVMSFSSAEEVGLRGATTAAFGLAPDLALVLEATVGNTPGSPPHKQPAQVGRGPAVTVADGRLVVPARLVDSLENAAQKAGIPCQRKLPVYGGTAGGAISLSRGGVPTAIVSVPTRYIHTPVSLMNLEDFWNTFRLAREWLGQVPGLLR